MDEAPAACNSRISDLKSFYPTKKSPHNKSVLKSISLSTTESESNFTKNDLNCSESSGSVITIDLSDDSLIESNELRDEDCTGNLKSIGNDKGTCDEIDLISVDSHDHSDNCSDDSVSTLVPSSPIGGKSTCLKSKSTVTISSYNFADSDDDSFLDIPLSQRIGLTENKSSDPKPSYSDDGTDKLPLSWLDDDSLETWTFTKDPILSSPGKSSPRKSQRNFCNSDESPFKRPTVNNLKKLEKRPYQSDTPPNKIYTSLKEKNRKGDDPVTKGNDKDEEEMYRIEETVTPVRKRRTPEEIQKAKEDKERRKAEKAEEKRAREKMKAKEKEKKAALREAGKTKLLSDCHKFCKTFADIIMLEKFKIADELQAIFREKEAKLILETNNSIDSGIHWVREQRDMVEEGNEDEGTVNLVRREVEADIILKVLSPAEYIPLMTLSISKIELESSDEESDGEEPGQTLFEYVTSLLDLYEKNLTLILFGFDKYSKQQKNRENSEYRAKMGLTKRSNKTKDAIPFLKKCELDLALFDLQVKLTESAVYSTKRVHVIQTETPTDLCHIIWCHTKATAMCSIKKSQREQQGLEWYAQNDGFGSVDINTDGDITSLWTKQLMSFTKMSEDMAKAVTEVYPSPRSLLSAYDQCSDETEKETLLSGIEVHRRNYSTGNTSKKLGPQVSRRIYLFMTTRDGDTIID